TSRAPRPPTTPRSSSTPATRTRTSSSGCSRSIAGVSNTFNVVAVHSSKCIVPSGDSTASNTPLVQLPCTTATTRVWRLPSFSSGPSSPPPSSSTSSGPRTFTNPLDLHGPDPWLKYYNGFYYLATTTWNSTITMRRSTTLGGLATAPDTVIFNLAGRAT